MWSRVPKPKGRALAGNMNKGRECRTCINVTWKKETMIATDPYHCIYIHIIPSVCVVAQPLSMQITARLQINNRDLLSTKRSVRLNEMHKGPPTRKLSIWKAPGSSTLARRPERASSEASGSTDARQQIRNGASTRRVDWLDVILQDQLLSKLIPRTQRAPSSICLF